MNSVSTSIQVVEAGPADLPDLLRLETSCFEPERRSKRRNLLHSLRSPAQKVWLLRATDGEAVAAMVCILYPKTLRVYSLCVAAHCRGAGLGAHLMAVAEAFARSSGRERIRLEAAVREKKLVGWYAGLGYRVCQVLPGYYAAGVDALRMEKGM